MRYSHRHNRSGARPELKALVAGLNRQPSFEDEVDRLARLLALTAT
jgi:hypothetical protein